MSLNTLRRRRQFRLSFYGLLAYIAIALYAPLLASDRPLVTWQESGLHFPTLVLLLDHNNYPSLMDRLCNFAGIYLIFIIVPAIRFWRRKKFRLLVGLIAIALPLFLYLEMHPQRRPWHDPANDRASWQISSPIGWSPRDVDISRPSPAAPDSRHWLGTDTEGRDLAARLIFATRSSLTAGLAASALALFFGTMIGMFSAWLRGFRGVLLSRLIDAMLCFPPLFLILSFSAFVRRPTLLHLVFFIALGTWAGVARLARDECRRLRDAAFVRAAEAQALSGWHILRHHLFPCILPSLRVQAGFTFASAVLLESTAAFVGLSDPILPTWGDMLNAGRISSRIWLILAPGFSIFLLILLLTQLGESLQERDSARGETT